MHVDLERLLRTLDGFRHRNQRRVMQHVLHAAHRRSHHPAVADIALADFHLPAQECEVLPVSGAEIIQNPDRMAPAHKGFGQMRSDKSRSPGDEIGRQCHPPPSGNTPFYRI
jgi:hypothetical protein